jgi:HEAT repeat protein
MTRRRPSTNAADAGSTADIQPPELETRLAILRDKDEDFTVRTSVALGLGKLKDSRALEPLLAALKDENAAVRRAATEALGILKYPQALEPFMAALKDDNLSVRVAVIEALGRLKDSRAFEPLFAAL